MVTGLTSYGNLLAHRLPWLAFYGAVLIAWCGLVLMAAKMPGFGMVGLTAPGLWEALCLSAADADPLALFSMWALMSVAMMMPTFVPAVRVFNDLGATGAADGRAMGALVLGYLGMWLGFSAMAAALQMVLSGAELLAPDGSSLSLWLTLALLAGAGLYQFSAFKEACLSRCRAPLAFFMERWAEGLGPAVRMGAQLGAHCVGCCWALMLLGFVGGTMNLAWMGVATLFMVLEKLPDLGRYLTRPAGWVLLGGAAYVLLTGLM